MTVVTNSIYVGPNALEGYVYVRGSLEDCLELVGQGDSLDQGGGEEEPPTWSWEHAIIWVNFDLPGRMGKSYLLVREVAGMLECVRRHAWKVLLCGSCLSRGAIVLFLR